MAFVRTGIGWLSVFGLLAACGSSDDADLGQADGSAGSGTGGSAGSASGGSAGSSAGSAGSSGSSGSSAGSGGAAGAECNGTHPLVDGGVRYCEPGQCRCIGSDLCFLQDRAARCCEGQLRCFTENGDVECTGSHPLVDGGARYCEDGACYCEANDTCFPAGIAEVCCGTGAKCG
jgi:hypothetical protein